MSQSLNTWMNGELVGLWSVDRGAHTFRYEASSLRSPHCRSLSLPISSSLESKGEIVGNYFDNLLPDNAHIRKRPGKRFHVKADTFGLLEAIGRDCGGAVPPAFPAKTWDAIAAGMRAEAKRFLSGSMETIG